MVLKPASAAGLFAMTHQRRADAAARTGGMDEKSADPCRVACGIQHAVGRGAVAVSCAEEGLAPAPAAASDNALALRGDEIGAVVDELRVDRKDRADRSGDLRR
jgi:hypothetical protein